MNCCTPNTEPGDTSTVAVEAVTNGRDGAETEHCRKCKRQTRPVSRKTVLLMLKPHLLEQAMTGSYSFCAAQECPVIYFEEQGNRRFTLDDLRVRVGVKDSADPIPLCYCFGFDENHIRDEMSQTGTTTIPDRISRLIREGLCACEARNPSGMCCLGEVNRTADRLRQTSQRCPTRE